MDILLCFSPATPTWTLSALSARLGLYKSTVHRLLHDLMARGLIVVDPTTQELRLGLKVLELGYVAERALDLRRLARPLMEELQATTGETIALSVLDGRESLCIEMVEGWHEVKLVTRLGYRQPLHAGASARTLLAYLPPAEIEQCLAGELLGLGPRTMTDPDQLREAIAETRRVGFAFSSEETGPGAAGLGAPIHDHQGQILASLSILGPLSRFGPERRNDLVRHLLRTANAIGLRIGGRPP
jgi:IclR family transcriptional regulator, KDG regulon repressor